MQEQTFAHDVYALNLIRGGFDEGRALSHRNTNIFKMKTYSK
jgi:hypothetical protein